MRWLDKVKVVSNKYESDFVKNGAVGRIILPEIKGNSFLVHFAFANGITIKDIMVKVCDLEIVEEENIAKDTLLKVLPQKDKSWWCIVENGVIYNLRGQRKNSVPFDYES